MINFQKQYLTPVSPPLSKSQVVRSLQKFNSLILPLTFTHKNIVPRGEKILRLIHILNSKSQPVKSTIKFKNAIIAGAT